MKRAEDLRPLAGELVEVNYRDPQSLHAGLEGADAIVHLAGALKPRRGETLQEANVATTKSIVEASLAARVNCFIYLSHPEADPASKNAYFQTKGAAEVIIREAGFTGAIFRVPMILGPGNASLDALVQMAKAPLAPLIGGGSVRVQPVYQSDVTTAIDWALSTCPDPMKVIDLVGPETITYAHLLQRVALRIGKHPKGFPCTQNLGEACRLARQRLFSHREYQPYLAGYDIRGTFARSRRNQESNSFLTDTRQ